MEGKALAKELGFEIVAIGVGNKVGNVEERKGGNDIPIVLLVTTTNRCDVYSNFGPESKLYNITWSC